jgi:hypothetical protein
VCGINNPGHTCDEYLVLFTKSGVTDEEFTRRHFIDLNRGVLRPPDDSKVIVLSDSEEEEVCKEEDAADAEAVPSSTVKSPAPTASTNDADDADKGHSLDQMIGDSSSGRDKASSP